MKQVRHLYVVVSEATGADTGTEQRTDVGTETSQALAGRLTGTFSLTRSYGLIFVIFRSTEDK